jgi:hypothetical protein
MVTFLSQIDDSLVCLDALLGDRWDNFLFFFLLLLLLQVFKQNGIFLGE